MRTVNIHAAKTHLSRLVDEAVRSGEPFVIAKAGKPLVKVTAIDAEHSAGVQSRRLGFLADQNFAIPDDFDTMAQDEIIAMFEGDD